MEKIAVIFGGTGFVGRNVVTALAQRGVKIIVPTRVPESAFFLKTAGDIGQINPILCDIHDYDDILNTIKGADYVINCIGIQHETRKNSFENMHVNLAESIASAAAISKVKRLVHISALVDKKSNSKYVQSKLAGEQKIRKNFKQATILRPSVIFGQDDNFFNRFAKMSLVLPFLPLIGGGHTQFQPVYVGDVTNAVITSLFATETNDASPLGKTYELGGPETLSFQDIYQKIFSYTNVEKPLVSVPFFIAKIKASILSLLTVTILTTDQVEGLKTDSVVGTKAKTLADLDIDATSTNVILPDYLTSYRPGGRFAD